MNQTENSGLVKKWYDGGIKITIPIRPRRPKQPKEPIKKRLQKLGRLLIDRVLKEIDKAVE